MKTLPDPEYFGYSIFCDDIRTEIGDKLTFIGIYDSGHMFVHGSFPITLPKFCIAVRYSQDRLNWAPAKRILIFLPGDPDDKPSFEMQLVNPADEAKGYEQTLKAMDNSNMDVDVFGLAANIVLAPFTIKETGAVKVRVERGDATLVKVGALQIRAAPTSAT